MEKKKYFWVIEVAEKDYLGEKFTNYRTHSVYETEAEALPVLEYLDNIFDLQNDSKLWRPSLMRYESSTVEEEKNMRLEYKSFVVTFGCNKEKKLAKMLNARPTIKDEHEHIEKTKIYSGGEIKYYRNDEEKTAVINEMIKVFLPINSGRNYLIRKAKDMVSDEGYIV